MNVKKRQARTLNADLRPWMIMTVASVNLFLSLRGGNPGGRSPVPPGGTEREDGRELPTHSSPAPPSRSRGPKPFCDFPRGASTGGQWQVLLNVTKNFRKFSQGLPLLDARTLLSDTEKRFLLRVARSSVESAVRKASPPSFDSPEPSLLLRCGAFVTLREGNELRGCIGYIDPIKPLVVTVQEVAAKAALEDTRFAPVPPEELEEINIEISVISPLSRLTRITDIELGKHGLLIEYKRSRGLLLPQVPREFGWDRDTFLLQTARKAGLPPLIWNDPDAETFIFTAEIFDEKQEIHEKI